MLLAASLITRLVKNFLMPILTCTSFFLQLLLSVFAGNESQTLKRKPSSCAEPQCLCCSRSLRLLGSGAAHKAKALSKVPTPNV